jgi:hypothetical protein
VNLVFCIWSNQIGARQGADRLNRVQRIRQLMSDLLVQGDLYLVSEEGNTDYILGSELVEKNGKLTELVGMAVWRVWSTAAPILPYLARRARRATQETFC